MTLNDYVIAFSSFYKAMYAQEKLMASRIRSTLKRLPAGVIQSCGYALYMNEQSVHESAKELATNGIAYMGIYRVENVNGKAHYRNIG